MKFIANLRDRTIETFGRHGLQPDAYLLSTHRITSASLEHAHALRDDGIPIMADNGSKELIDQVISNFRPPAREIWNQVRDIRHEVGRTPRGSDIPDELRDKASELAWEVVEMATDLSSAIDSDALLEQQLSMRPTHLIAQEDFCVACLLALNLERETTGWRVSIFETRNRRSLGLWRRVASDSRLDGIKVYAVLSAADYNTARAAGRLAAEAGVEHVAIGCAGFMLDRTAVDFYTLETANYTLPEPAPRRYVRFAQVIAGIRDGYKDQSRELASLHTLGLGAPVMFPMLSAAVPSNTAITTDATSPIHDAVRDRVLYDSRAHGSRLPEYRIVTRILSGEDWPFDCPFCTHFKEQHGHSAQDAKAAWESAGEPEVDNEFLRTNADLAAAIPLFAGDDPERTAQRTHIAHNHWVLGTLARDVPDGDERWSWSVDRITDLQATTSLVTARGLTRGLEILQQLHDE